MNGNRSFAAFAAWTTFLAGLAAGASPAASTTDSRPAANAADSTPEAGGSKTATTSPDPPAAAGSPAAFYQSRLAAGEQALAAGRAAEAADNLRVASFGLLDQPEKLSECLVVLAVAQQRAGRTADAEATLRRFRSAQELFPSWERLALAPELRSEFVALARKRLPEMNLEMPHEAGRQPPPGAPSARVQPPSSPSGKAPGPGRTSS
jgi:hypothetical protein